MEEARDGIVGEMKVGEEEDQIARQQRIDRARKRLKERPKIWRPAPGEDRAVLVEKIEKREDIGDFDKPAEVFILRDLETDEKVSLVACGYLLKHLKQGSEYIIQYEGKTPAKINGVGQVEVQNWSVEKI